MRWSTAVLLCGYSMAAQAVDPIHRTFADWTLSDKSRACMGRTPDLLPTLWRSGTQAHDATRHGATQ